MNRKELESCLAAFLKSNTPMLMILRVFHLMIFSDGTCGQFSSPYLVYYIWCIIYVHLTLISNVRHKIMFMLCPKQVFLFVTYTCNNLVIGGPKFLKVQYTIYFFGANFHISDQKTPKISPLYVIIELPDHAHALRLPVWKMQYCLMIFHLLLMWAFLTSIMIEGWTDANRSPNRLFED